ncbi:hypothetical protein [Bradyrhizobium sp. CCBAU 53421]|uniref:hypothetical protein n=1 Tax=Bradyrhizobium sp. CCBAU 53421 TaxID=1325120 RepID=UPI00188CDD87|nr:hypothetical protein [Bradyrhizobium sp. CCBAU 53421]QOZ35044.1 hypothetical protein XH92_27990 [Bradyrhizobium sp. CCBAU 53421]
MKNTTRLLLIAVAGVMMASEACAAPVQVMRLSPQHPASVVRVRLACDQNCHCWQTRYQQRSYRRKIDDQERQDPNSCPGGGHYNGHCRSGPATGLGFESRLPVRSLPFPF